MSDTKASIARVTIKPCVPRGQTARAVAVWMDMGADEGRPPRGVNDRSRPIRNVHMEGLLSAAFLRAASRIFGKPGFIAGTEMVPGVLDVKGLNDQIARGETSNRQP